jgi:hypothetical protein
MKEVFSSPLLVADKALSWLQRNLDGFEPFQGTNQPEEYRQKALVELALLCLYLHSHPTFSYDERVTACLDFIREVHRNPYFRDGMFRLGNLFLPHGILTVVLCSCGLLGDECDWKAIQELVDNSNITCTERLPFRSIELWLVLGHGGFGHRLPSPKEFYRHSMLSKRINPIYVSNEDAYAITHTLFYLSDFTRHPISVFYPKGADRAHWVVEQLLGMYVQKMNWDLVGELLLSCACLRKTTSDLYRLGWQALSDAQLPDGAVPGPVYDSRHAEGLESKEKRNYLFERFYHTTLVAVFAGAMCPSGGTTDEM